MKSCQLCGTEIRWLTEQLSVGITRMSVHYISKQKINGKKILVSVSISARLHSIGALELRSISRESTNKKNNSQISTSQEILAEKVLANKFLPAFILSEKWVNQPNIRWPSG